MEYLMIPNHYEMSFQLQATDVDFRERLKPSAMLSEMQMIADHHASLLGCSQPQIEKDNLCWVIARLRVDMLRYPKYGEEIRLLTWPGQYDRLTFPRFFRYFDSDGNTLINATLKYKLINLLTREFVRPDTVDFYKSCEPLREEVNPSPERIRLKNSTRETVFRAPVFSDIDINRHMNNTRYAEWICDLFGTSVFETQALKSLQINYVSDGLEGHKIALDVEESATGFLVKGTDTVSEKIVFESAGEWMADLPETL